MRGENTCQQKAGSLSPLSLILISDHLFIYSRLVPPISAIPPATLLENESCETSHAGDPVALAEVGRRLLDAGTVQAVADVFKLLGDPTRVRLVDALSHGERCVCDLASLVRLSESAVSHQLRLLRGARLVRVRRTGRQAFYALDDHHVLGLVHDTRRHVEEGDVTDVKKKEDAGQ